jgi:hypothetical protein
MRESRQPRSNSELPSLPQPFSDPNLAAPVARIFVPSELDLDAFAAAVRSLLVLPGQPTIDQFSRPHRDLLSLPHRVTHVVEAKKEA